MTRFLLGSLTPAERELIEARLAADPAYFEALCALEDELILRWHRGELSENERQAFAGAYLASPGRAARVEGGRLLIGAIDDVQRQQAAHVSWRARRWLATPWQVPRLAAAAAAVLLVAVVPALYEMGAVIRRLQRVERENATLRRNIGVTPHRTVVFPLSPVTERGNETPSGSNTLRIPRDADDVWLQFEVVDPGPAAEFEAVLEPIDHTLATVPRPVRLERTAKAALVTLTVAAVDLLDGDYVLKLRRPVAGGSFEVVAARTFRVLRN
jgi:hypothetical protein